MSGADSTDVLGSTWRRNPPGREVVEVQRAWVMDGVPTVRAHPVRGGRPLVASVAYLYEHYTRVTTPEAGQP